MRGAVALAGGVKEVVGQAKLSNGAEEGDGRGGARRWSRGMGGRRRRRRRRRREQSTEEWEGGPEEHADFLTRPHCRNARAIRGLIVWIGRPLSDRSMKQTSSRLLFSTWAIRHMSLDTRLIQPERPLTLTGSSTT